MSALPEFRVQSSSADLRPALEIGQVRHLEALVGNTPMLAFPNLTKHLPEQVSLFAKAEWANPGGSVKDRPALNIILEAERRGDLRPSVTLLDSTSGNMGIAYAMFCRARGHAIRLVIPANCSPERLAILRAYGVDLVLSDPLEGGDGAIREVHRLYEQDPERYFFADQYNNQDNWRAHYKSTGVEIWAQTAGQVTHFVAGMGTSGTIMGAGRRLKECNPAIKLVAVQPESPLHGLEGLKHMPTAIRPGIYDQAIHDEIAAVSTEDAHAMCRRIAREEGVLIGVSAGAALAAALRKAEQLAETGQPGVVVTLLPDNASKYLSEPFWAEG